MPFIEWNNNYAVGVPEIDEDHKKLFSLLNDLSDAVDKGCGHEALAKTLEGLIFYASYHFKHEEGLFLRANYPNYEEHKREHELLTQKVLVVQSEFLVGQCDTLPLDVLEFLKDWLFVHTTGSDRRFGVYLNANAIEE